MPAAISPARGIARPAAAAEVMLLHVHQGEKPASAAFPPEVDGHARNAEARRREALAAWGPGSRKIELKRR